MGAGRSRVASLNSVIGDEDDGLLSGESIPDEVSNLIDKDIDTLMNLTDKDIAPLDNDEIYDVLDRLGIDEVGARTILNSKSEILDIMEINNDDEAPYRVRVALNTLSNIFTTYEKSTGDKLIENFSFVKDRNESVVGKYIRDKNSVLITFSDLSYDLFNRKAIPNFNALPIKAKGSVSHELGHAVMYKLQQGSNKEKLNAFNKKVSGTSAVSTYGNVSLDEAFAEAFSLYSHGVSKSTKEGTKYYSEFKKLMKDCGLENLYGCTK